MNYWTLVFFFSGLSIGIYYKDTIYKYSLKFLMKIIGYYFVLKKNLADKYLKNDTIQIKNIVITEQNTTSKQNNTFKKYTKFLDNIVYCDKNIYQIDYDYQDKMYTMFFDKINKLNKNLFKNNILIKNINKFTQGADDIILIELTSNDSNFTINYNSNDESQYRQLEILIKKFSGPKGNFYSDISFYEFNSKYLNNAVCELFYLKSVNISIMYSTGDIINY